MRWVCASTLPLMLAACGQGGPDNVMTPSANALPPALVDLALGPETPDAAANMIAAENAGTSARPVEADEPALVPRTSNRIDDAPAVEPADATAEEEAAETNNVDE